MLDVSPKLRAAPSQEVVDNLNAISFLVNRHEGLQVPGATEDDPRTMARCSLFEDRAHIEILLTRSLPKDPTLGIQSFELADDEDVMRIGVTKDGYTVLGGFCLDGRNQPQVINIGLKDDNTRHLAPLAVEKYIRLWLTDKGVVLPPPRRQPQPLTKCRPELTS